MMLSPLTVEPQWPRLYTACGVGTACLLTVAVMFWRTRKAKKRDVYQPSTLFAEAFGIDPKADVETTGSDQEGDTLPGTKRLESASIEPVFTWSLSPEEAARVRTPRFFLGVAMLVATAAGCFLSALIWYVILVNWDDGERRAVIGDNVGAIVCYKKALRANPMQPRTHLLIAQSELASGKTNAAIEDLRWIVQRRPDVVQAAIILGDALQSIGRPAEAVEAYRVAIRQDGYNPAYEIALGTALAEVGKYDEADAAYEKAISLDKDSAIAHVKLGSMLVVTGHMDEGLSHCRKAVRISPKSEMAQSALGAAYARFGEYSMAAVCLRKAIDFNPKFPVAYFNLGVVYERQNRLAEAKDQFEKCSQLVPATEVEKLVVVEAKKESERLRAFKH
jgi:tetratricopeptide (TPR) repeat protein